MAHGSKKWIVDYRGNCKRSTDRTKLDYYGQLADWQPMYYAYRWRAKSRGEFCPQCKHVGKAIDQEHREVRAEVQRLHLIYTSKYKDVLIGWHAYRVGKWRFDASLNIKDYVPTPLVREPPTFAEWCKKKRIQVPIAWTHDTRSMLCYKHERWYEIQQRMWRDHIPGSKSNYRNMVKDSRRAYRNKVRGTLQRAKYNSELYDQIPNRVREWLD